MEEKTTKVRLKPALPNRVDTLENVEFPVYAHPILGGERCFKHNGEWLRANGKKITCTHINDRLPDFVPDGIDGEIVACDGSDIRSAVLDCFATPEFVFVAYDLVGEDAFQPYCDRLSALVNWFDEVWHDKFDAPIDVAVVEKIENPGQFLLYERSCVSNDYAGVVVRQPDNVYKRGACPDESYTEVVRYQEGTATIVDFKSKTELKDGEIVEKNDLGGLVVEHPDLPSQFEVAAPRCGKLRGRIWNCKRMYRGATVKFKYMLPPGPGFVPVLPLFVSVDKVCCRKGVQK